MSSASHFADATLDRACVSLDLETTGLDAEEDRIIEIGAVKFRGREVIDTFRSLVNPHRPLPNRVAMLTGISGDELVSAPAFSEICDDLRSFVGDCPIVGQNINFDLAFLQAAGVTFGGEIYDTLDVANMLLPHLLDYSLPALAEQMGIQCDVHHRALDDAVTAKEVFLALLDVAAGLDLPLLAELNRLTASVDWPWRALFQEIERNKVGTVSLWDRGQWEADLVPHSVELSEREPLVPSDELRALDVDRLTGLLDRDGPMSRVFPGFEHRPGQVAMMQEVAGAFNEGRRLIIEAGTGIGKSMAYLLPSACFALENGVPVVISTNTINLQEQLMNKDMPDLLSVLSTVTDGRTLSELRVAQLKGRSNYICVRRWDTWRKTPNLPWDEARFLLRLMAWLARTSSGDRAELSLSAGEHNLWNRVCASEENCVTERCPYYPSGCFLYRARHLTEGAHLIVVNHALLLSDLVSKGGILPEYGHLVIDEAHRLEEEATDKLGFQISSSDVQGVLGDLGERGSFLFHLRRYLRTASVASARRNRIEQEAQGVLEEADSARSSGTQFFEAVARLVGQASRDQGDYDSHLRLTDDVRRHQAWSDVELAWENLDLELGSVGDGLLRLHGLVEDLASRRSDDLSGSLAEVCALRQQVGLLRSRLETVVAGPEEQDIYWATVKVQGGVYLNAAPLRVGPLLDRLLFSQKECVVLTSATLSTGGDFEYVRDALGLAEAEELMVEAPFDYPSSTLIYLPNDIPEPHQPRYKDRVACALEEIGRVTQGRTLALFTSHAALRTAYGTVQPRLEEEGILVLGQGVDGSPKRVLKSFTANPNSLLMGASALWEGVDVVGRALSVLVIARLPFGVPTDPVLSARCELYDDSFNQYLVPQAALKFKQGFGRLIRSSSDRGVVVVLDKRIQTKSYGRLFLQSLPECTVRSGSLADLPQNILDWLDD